MESNTLPTAFTASHSSNTVTNVGSTSNPIVIVIDEEQDSANIFVVPCGQTTGLNTGRISLSNGDVGSLVLDLDDSDPESQCTCVIECWVYDTDALNRPKTNVSLCPRCLERSKMPCTTTLTISRPGESSTSAGNRPQLTDSLNGDSTSFEKRLALSTKRKQKCRKLRSNGLFKCLKCRKVLTTVERFQKHVAEHKKSRSFRCPHCIRVFRLRHSAALHILKEHKK